MTAVNLIGKNGKNKTKQDLIDELLSSKIEIKRKDKLFKQKLAEIEKCKNNFERIISHKDKEMSEYEKKIDDSFKKTYDALYLNKIKSLENRNKSQVCIIEQKNIEISRLTDDINKEVERRVLKEKEMI